MPEDYYTTLGVSRNATADEIQQAYRQLVRKYHPDMNPDDASAKKKFQLVQSAFDVLNDKEKRGLYDRYGSNYESVTGGPGGSGSPRGRSPGFGGAGGPGYEINLEDLFGANAGAGGGGGGFADLFKNFGGRSDGRKQRAPKKNGTNLQHQLTIPFTTAILGGEAQITVQRANGQSETLQVKVPAGIEDGKKIRLRGQGEASATGGPAGDILIKVQVSAHPLFRRQGNRLDVSVPISLSEAIQGAKIDVPTPQGTITLSIPPNTSSGTKLRVKGHGVNPQKGSAGDLIAEVSIMLPQSMKEADRKQLEKILSPYSENPRKKLQW